MNVIICGLAKGETKKYQCSGCGFESDEQDDFAVSLCWSCAFDPADEPEPDPTERPLWETCSACNYDKHICPGCGANIPHGTSCCKECAEL